MICQLLSPLIMLIQWFSLTNRILDCFQRRDKTPYHIFPYTILKASKHSNHVLECSSCDGMKPSTLVKQKFLLFWVNNNTKHLWCFFGGCMIYGRLRLPTPKKHSIRKQGHIPTMFPRGLNTLQSRGPLIIGFN